jgi:hypothetical protein
MVLTCRLENLAQQNFFSKRRRTASLFCRPLFKSTEKPFTFVVVGRKKQQPQKSIIL